MVEYKILGKGEYVSMENIRMEVYGLSESSLFFIDSVTSGRMIPVGVFVDNKLIGGAYISKSLKSLYIENIFIKSEYQHKGYAKGLLKYIFDNKKLFEEYFNMEFLFSKLEPNSNDIIEFYKSVGFSEPNDLNVMRKRI